MITKRPTLQKLPQMPVPAKQKMTCPAGHIMFDGACIPTMMPLLNNKSQKIPEYEKFFPRKKKAPIKSYFA